MKSAKQAALRLREQAEKKNFISHALRGKLG